MIKLVVLFALVAVAVAKPGYLHGGLGYSAIAVAPAVAVPAAVSHTYRADYISKPVIAVPAVHTVPVFQKTFVAAPVAYAHAPVIAYSGHPW